MRHHESVSDEPDDPNDESEQENYFAGDPGPSEDDEVEFVVPKWQIPGLDAYVRSIVDPIYEQLGGLSNVFDIAAAMPKFELPKIDVPTFEVPRIEVSPEFLRSVTEFNRALESMREAIASMVNWSKLAQSFIDPAVFERFRELVARRMPPNWSEVDDWRRGTTFIEESGWAIVWLPRSEVVLALLDADEADRESVLLAHSSVLVEDALACAAEIKHDELRFVGDCIVEIAESVSDGHHRAAQALSASVLTELLQGILGHKKLADAHAEYAEPWKEQSIQLLRFVLIACTIPKALSRFYRDNGDPMPPTFNRHAVAHGASPVQFTPLNALVGLVLVTALTRELQALYDEGLLTDDE